MNQQQEEQLYKSLESLQLELNNLVRKSEELLSLSLDVSYQATLKRLCASFPAIVGTRPQKAFFPPMADQESYERKFKLIRRSCYILHDAMRGIKDNIRNLHDATRLQKQEMVKMQQKSEIIDEGLELISKDEALQLQQQQQQRQRQPKYIQIVNVDEDDDIAIIPKEEPVFFEIPKTLIVSGAGNYCYHISCVCFLEQQFQKLPFEVKLCIAFEAIAYFEPFLLNTQLVEKIVETEYIDVGSEECLTYEMMYIIEKHPLKRQKFLPYLMPFVQLEFDKKYQQDYNFPLFGDLSELTLNTSLFIHTFLVFTEYLKNGISLVKGGNLLFLIRFLQQKQRAGYIINAYHPLLDKCQIMVDLIYAIYQLNQQNTVIGVNQLLFPETLKNPKMIMSRYTKNLSKNEQELLSENIFSGCRIAPKGTKEPRTFLIFSKDKIMIPTLLKKVKYWQIPVEWLNELEKSFHYNFLVYYIDLVVRNKFADKYQKFYTLLFSALKDSGLIQKDNQQKIDFDKFVHYKDYTNYFYIKTKSNEVEESLLEKLEQQKIKCYNQDISRLFALQE